MKKLKLFLSAALMLSLAYPLVQAIGQAGGIEEFNYFKHFDRREDLIHVITEHVTELNSLPEDPAYVKRGQMIRWGFEFGPYANLEQLQATIESYSLTTVFKIDGVAVDDGTTVIRTSLRAGTMMVMVLETEMVMESETRVQVIFQRLDNQLTSV